MNATMANLMMSLPTAAGSPSAAGTKAGPAGKGKSKLKSSKASQSASQAHHPNAVDKGKKKDKVSAGHDVVLTGPEAALFESMAASPEWAAQGGRGGFEVLLSSEAARIISRTAGAIGTKPAGKAVRTRKASDVAATPEGKVKAAEITDGKVAIDPLASLMKNASPVATSPATDAVADGSAGQPQSLAARKGHLPQDMASSSRPVDSGLLAGTTSTAMPPASEIIEQLQARLPSTPGLTVAAAAIYEGNKPQAARNVKKGPPVKAGSLQQADKASQGEGLGLYRRIGELAEGGEGSGRFSIGRTAGQSDSTSDNASLGLTEAIGRAEVTELPATATSKPATLSPAATQVTDAFQTSASRQGGRITIQLNPPELGRVSIRLSAIGNQVRGVLEVENQRTLDQFHREAPLIIERLAEAGIQIRRMDVQLSDSNGGSDSGAYSQMQDDGGAQGNSWSRNQQETSADADWLDDTEIQDSQAGTPAVVGDDLINVWI